MFYYLHPRKNLLSIIVLLFYYFQNSFCYSQNTTTDIIRLSDLERVGAVCNDGTRSASTNTGTCSQHGGVKYWIYTEKSTYQANISNLPAIPENQLIRLSPKDVFEIVRLGLDIGQYFKEKKKGNQTDNKEDKQKYTHSENAHYHQNNYGDFYLQLFNAFIIVLALTFTAIFVVAILKKI